MDYNLITPTAWIWSQVCYVLYCWIRVPKFYVLQHQSWRTQETKMACVPLMTSLLRTPWKKSTNNVRLIHPLLCFKLWAIWWSKMRRKERLCCCPDTNLQICKLFTKKEVNYRKTLDEKRTRIAGVNRTIVEDKKYTCKYKHGRLTHSY